MTAPIPRIFLALDGKVDFLKKTNPYGPAEEAEPVKDAKEQEKALLRWAESQNRR